MERAASAWSGRAVRAGADAPTCGGIAEGLGCAGCAVADAAAPTGTTGMKDIGAASAWGGRAVRAATWCSGFGVTADMPGCAGRAVRGAAAGCGGKAEGLG